MMRRIQLCVLGMTAFVAMNSSAVWINEFHYDNASGDVGEFVEIAGTAGVDVNGWSIVLYNGGNGQSYHTETLSGTIDDEGQGFGALSFLISGLQNGAPDGIALVDAGSVVWEFLSYEGSFAATDGPATGATSTDIGVSETTSTVVGDSLQLTGNYDLGFSWTGPTEDSPGLLNLGQVFPQTGPELPDNRATVPDVGASALLLFGSLSVMSLFRRRETLP